MIKAHFHKIAGVKYCHLYSDKHPAELETWMKNVNIPETWLHKEDKFPHLDLWGSKLYWAYRFKEVSTKEFAEDLNDWRIKQAERKARRAASKIYDAGGLRIKNW